MKPNRELTSSKYFNVHRWERLGLGSSALQVQAQLELELGRSLLERELDKTAQLEPLVQLGQGQDSFALEELELELGRIVQLGPQAESVLLHIPGLLRPVGCLPK